MFLSVILCTYNRAHLVQRAIESVLAQSFDDYELIIIDDGSYDNTKEVIAPYLGNHRIQYHYIPNGGHSKARDFGCSLASGRFLTFIDSDDEYYPHHLESRYNILVCDPTIELLHGGVEIIGSEFVADKNDTTKLVTLSDCAIGGTFFIRRDLWKRIDGFGDALYGDDSSFFERATERGAVIRKTNISSYRYYRTEADSLCTIVERSGLDGILTYRKLMPL